MLECRNQQENEKKVRFYEFWWVPDREYKGFKKKSEVWFPIYTDPEMNSGSGWFRIFVPDRLGSGIGFFF